MENGTLANGKLLIFINLQHCACKIDLAVLCLVSHSQSQTKILLQLKQSRTVHVVKKVSIVYSGFLCFYPHKEDDPLALAFVMAFCDISVKFQYGLQKIQRNILCHTSMYTAQKV